MNTIVIDGSHGEGGGQIIRTSVALSALLGARTIVENIRPRREPPGLQRTHLEAIRGIASLAGVVLEGDALGSVRLVLNPPPQPPLGEQWRPSSHATSLIVQTVLGPSLAVASTTSRILTKSAPTPERISEIFLQTLQRHGWPLDFQLDDAGAIVGASSNDLRHVRPFDLVERGALHRLRIHLSSHRVESSALDDLENALRQVATAIRPALPVEVVRRVRDYESDGVACTTVLTHDSGSLGDDGAAPADQLDDFRESRCRALQTLLESDAPVDESASDQLVLPAALCAVTTGATSRFKVVLVSEHLRTVLWLVERFLPIAVHVDESTRLVTVGARGA